MESQDVAKVEDGHTMATDVHPIWADIELTYCGMTDLMFLSDILNF